jgi:hypothetical protein
MKHLLNFDKFSLNELKVNSMDTDWEGKNFISYRGDVWIFDDDEWEDEYWDVVSQKMDFELSEFWDDNRETLEEIPYILTGEIRDDKILIDGTKNFRHSPMSDDLRKLSKELNMPVEIRAYKDENLDEEFFEEELVDSIKDATFYHGTCIKFLPKIARTGIMPVEHTNFKDIEHDDKVFVTTNLEKAKFHAVHSSINNNSYPVILEFKIPDPSKLVIDFDLAVDLLGVEHETSRELGYSNIALGYGKQYQQYRMLDADEKMDMAKKLGTFGYTGRIPASQISLLIDDEALEQYWYLFDEDYGYMEEEIGHYHPMFSDIEELSGWKEYSWKEYKDFTNDLIETLASEYREDEDYDEDYE